MNWYRSWPADPPEGRASVADSLPRLVMSGYDYSTIQDWPADEPGLCLLEWDVALDAVGRDLFAELAAVEPHSVLVAPYPIYPVGGRPACAHRNSGRPIGRGDQSAETFGLGCVYLPRKVIDEWPGGRMTDRSLSVWHHRLFGPARVAWDVHPQHLHGD